MLTAAFAGALVAIGLLVAVFALRGGGAPLPSSRRQGPRPRRERIVRAGSAAAAGMAVLALTGAPLLTVGAALAAAALPAVWRQRHDQTDQRCRVEAVAAWTEMLRDAVSSGRGVQEAIAVTAPLAPTALRPAVLSLRARSVRGPLAPALRAFADEVADPMADLVAAALTLAATREVRELSDLLGALADTTRQRAALRLATEAGRAGLRTTARAIGGVTVVALGGMFALQPSYLAPYSTPSGQLVLVAAGSWFLLGFWGLSRLGRPAPPRRLFLREVTL